MGRFRIENVHAHVTDAVAGQLRWFLDVSGHPFPNRRLPLPASPSAVGTHGYKIIIVHIGLVIGEAGWFLIVLRAFQEE